MVPERGNKNILLNCLFSLQIHLSLLKRIFKNAQWGKRLYEVAFEPTLPTDEILSVKNARASLVCGFLIKSFKKIYPENMKKIVGAVCKLLAK